MKPLLMLSAFCLSLLCAPSASMADDESPWAKEEKEQKEEEEKKKKEEEEQKKKEEEEAAAAAAEEEARATEEAAAEEARAQAEAEAERASSRRGSGSEYIDEEVLPPKGGGPVGLGFAVGTINGMSLKIWPHRVHGMVLTVGVPNLLNSMAVGLSYRAHPKAILVPNSPVALHVNVGPAFRARMVFGTGVFAELAGGLALGVSVTVDEVPAEIYFDVVPLFAGSVTPVGTGLGFHVDGIVGARFYF